MHQKNLPRILRLNALHSHTIATSVGWKLKGKRFLIFLDTIHVPRDVLAKKDENMELAWQWFRFCATTPTPLSPHRHCHFWLKVANY